MIVSLIAAADLEWGIGRDGKVPWHLKADLVTFKNLTLGHHLLMGRKTFESIGRNLPGRQTILLTRQRDFSVDKTIIASSLEQAIDLAEGHQEQELFIVGGGEIFSQAIAQANRIYLTRVFARAGCDVFFPHLESGIWAELETAYFRADSRNDYSFIFSRMTRFKRNSP